MHKRHPPTGRKRPLPGDPRRLLVGGIEIDCMTRRSFTERMVADWRRNVAAGRQLTPQLVFDVNGQAVSMYASMASYRALLDQADLMPADGMSLVFASRLLTREPLPERVCITDAFHDLAEAAAQEGISFYFLGASPQANADAVANVRKWHPHLKISGCRHGMFRPDEATAIADEIVAGGTDVLWIAMGRGKQEQYAVDQLQRLTGVTWLKTCGGLFDFLAEHVSRAPQWLQRLGLEWMHRTIQEPRRLFVRYLVTNPHAIYCMLAASRTLPEDPSASADIRADRVE